MEFFIEKCALLTLEIGKGEITEITELPNQKRIRTFGEKEIQVLGNIGCEHEQTSRNERKYQKRVPQMTKKTRNQVLAEIS